MGRKKSKKEKASVWVREWIANRVEKGAFREIIRELMENDSRGFVAGVFT
jgi:hypothetical protein